MTEATPLASEQITQPRRLSKSAAAAQKKMGSVPGKQRDLLWEIDACGYVGDERIPYYIPLDAGDRDSSAITALIQRGLVEKHRNFLRLTSDGETMIAAMRDMGVRP